MDGDVHHESCMCADCLEEEMRMVNERGEEVFNLSDGEEEGPARRIVRHEDDSISSKMSSTRATGVSELLQFDIHLQDVEREAFWIEERKKSRPAAVLSLADLEHLRQLAKSAQQSASTTSIVQKPSTLGQVHLDLARYHELGRFISPIEGEGEAYDHEAAIFHLEMAHRCGNLEATMTQARIIFDLPHELLRDINSEAINMDEEDGLQLMEMAGDMGDVTAMLFLADAFFSGQHLGPIRKINWETSLHWYESANDQLQGFCEEETGTELRPRYEVLARMAEMCKQGENGLEMDTARAYDLFNEAAEAASEAMKGKLANKFYMLAEECA